MNEKNVLIADHSESELQKLNQLLRKLGIRVTETDDGEQAVKNFKKEEYTHLILNIRLNTLDGFQVISIVKRLPNEVNIIVFSEYLNMNSINQLKTLGVKNIFVKPDNKEGYLATVGRIAGLINN